MSKIKISPEVLEQVKQSTVETIKAMNEASEATKNNTLELGAETTPEDTTPEDTAPEEGEVTEPVATVTPDYRTAEQIELEDLRAFKADAIKRRLWGQVCTVCQTIYPKTCSHWPRNYTEGWTK